MSRMNCSQLLNRSLANQLVCQTQQIAIGPTGPAGGSETIPGALKAFTVFIDYDSSPSNPISRLYIPPGLFSDLADPRLVVGGIFTTDIGTDLQFTTQTAGILLLNNTKYPFASGLSANGYINPGIPSTPRWQIVAQGNIRPESGKIYYTITNDYSLTLSVPLQPINGGQTAVRPSAGIARNFLGTVTIFFV